MAAVLDGELRGGCENRDALYTGTPTGLFHPGPQPESVKSEKADQIRNRHELAPVATVRPSFDKSVHDRPAVRTGLHVARRLFEEIRQRGFPG
ncbi:hypothetical protein ACFV84_28285 [Kitasatospora sp. NPDC059811]|uniref:hypothetical protein n=1 Tax=Streptomycetaceae TaxID=2062 RepID=UPI0007AFC998|nr:hypothetical protein [Streptomyces sp. MJM8645]